MSEMLKLMVIDDSNIINQNIIRYSNKKHLDVVERVTNEEDAIKTFKNHNPNIVVLDTSTLKSNGVSCIERLMNIDKNTRIVLVSTSPDEASCIQGVNKGAIGFLRKPFIAEQLFEVLNIKVAGVEDPKTSPQ